MERTDKLRVKSKCSVCHKFPKETEFRECSHVDCPHRSHLTAVSRYARYDPILGTMTNFIKPQE